MQSIKDLSFKKYYFNQKFGWSYWKSIDHTAYRKTNFTTETPPIETHKDSCTLEFPEMIASVKILQDEFPSAMVRIRTKENPEEDAIMAWIDLKFFTNGDDAHFCFVYYNDKYHDMGYDSKSIAVINAPRKSARLVGKIVDPCHSHGNGFVNYIPAGPTSITLPNTGASQQVLVNSNAVVSVSSAPSGTVTISSLNGSSIAII